MMRQLLFALIIFCQLLLAACGNDNNPRLSPLDQNAVILAFGDSLTFGTGADNSLSYPRRLAKLTSRQVINAGIPGEVTGKAVQRLPGLLKQYQPDLVILVHGGNDLLRKLDKDQIANNLETMITEIRNSGAELIMMAVPRPSLLLNPAALYQEVAEKNEIPIDLDTLSEILQSPNTKSDAIHPNAQGYLMMAENLHALMQQKGAL